MINYLILPILVLLTVLLTYVLAQNPHAVPNRLFGWYVGIALLTDIGSIIQLTARDLTVTALFGAVLGPLLGLSSLLLMWLVLALFLPERYAQSGPRWLIGTPYLVGTLISLVAPITGLFPSFAGVQRGADGTAILLPAPFNPLLGAYIAGAAATIILTAAIAIRRRVLRVPAAIVCGGLLVSQVVAGSEVASQYPVFYALGPLPVFLAFAWVALRYQVFRPSALVFQTALESLPDGILILDAAQQVRYANPAARRLLLLADTDAMDLLPVILDRAAIRLDQQQAAASYRRTRYIRTSEPQLILESAEATVRDLQGLARVLVLRDVTHSEQQAAVLAEQNEQQRRLLDLVATLETPITTLAEGVVFVPVVGSLDSGRSHALTTRLLNMVHTQRVRLAILDVAGVPTIDPAAANALRQIVQALRLLGCEVAISGISAAVAITITQAGIRLDDVVTTRSPQEALGQAGGRAAGRGGGSRISA